MVLPQTPDLNSNPSSDDEVSEAEMPPDECEIETLDESPISFRLSGPNPKLGRFDKSDEEPASSGDSVVHSPRRKPRRWRTRKEKGKKKMLEHGTDKGESDRRKYDCDKSDDGPSRAKSTSAKKASTSATEQLRQKNPVLQSGYKEYMAHHYAYMTRVAEVHEPESYAEVAKHAN